MVIVKLFGGLGNQMFQYAAGLRLARVQGTELKLDITAFRKNSLRRFDLPGLNITAAVANEVEIRTLTGSRFPSWIPFLPASLTMNRRHILEKHFHFDPEILDLPDNVYLDGYWQSEKYFIDIQDIIRSEFSVKTPLSRSDRDLLDSIQSCDSVSLHIRRGDYASDPGTRDFHGMCSPHYYHVCMDRISQQLGHPQFFVFSDDPAWAGENLSRDFSLTIIDHNGPENAHEDLRLMLSCRHHIIANSSFSWWGAWLCSNPGKIVYAPERWFANAPLDTRDLLPEEWIRI